MICPFCHNKVFRGGVKIKNRSINRVRLAHKKCAARNIDYTTLHQYKYVGR
jgi:hypothetical protein